jgi:hypothetical protein
MEPLTFSFADVSPAERVDLVRSPVSSIPDTSWQELSNYVAHERGLRPCSANVLSERWQQGCAAVAIQDDQIVGYISIVELLGEVTWGRFNAEIRRDCVRPNIDMYGLATGWTHPAWRQKRVSLELRRQLLARFDDSNRLCISVTAGLGASPVLARLGWHIVAWSEIPYTSGLAGVPIAGFGDLVGEGWRLPPGMVPYEGQHTAPDQETAHDWKPFCYLWVSSVALATELDNQLLEMMDGDLRRWREIVITVFTVRPASPWTLHLL